MHRDDSDNLLCQPFPLFTIITISVMSPPVLFHVGRHSPAVGVRVVALHRLEAGDAVEAAAHEQLVTDGDGAYGTGKDTRPCDSL